MIRSVKDSHVKKSGVPLKGFKHGSKVVDKISLDVRRVRVRVEAGRPARRLWSEKKEKGIWKLAFGEEWKSVMV